MRYIQPGTAAFWRANLALFLGGFVTFATLYGPQPLLPTFAEEFGLTAATASLALSVATATLSVSLLVAATLSESLGRKSVMGASLFVTAGLMLAAAASPDFGSLLVVRALQGIAMAGLPAIALAYLGEEMHPTSLGFAVGLYIGGNAVGGMSGRLVVGVLADAFSWRAALAGVGGLSLLATVCFWLSLPASRNFQPRPPASPWRALGPALEHLRDPALRYLYGVGFLLLGSFVALYNYVAFHLMAPPYGLSQAAVGWIFSVYLVGIASSTGMGRLADRVGRRKVLWTGLLAMAAGAALTAPESLAVKVLGIAVFTFGFFAGHSIASSWVARRVTAHRAQASALYLLFYYGGASVGGWAGGLFWGAYGWPGVLGMIGAALVAGLALAVRLTRIPPRAPAGL